MGMIKLPLVLLFTTMCLSSFAHPIDVEEARAIAMDFMLHHDDGYVNGRMAKHIRLNQYVPETAKDNLKM